MPSGQSTYQLPVGCSLEIRRRSPKIRKQLFRRYRQRFGQLDDVFQTHVPLTALHAADVVSMEISPFRQFLLREAALLTETADLQAEVGFDRTRGHPPILGW